MKIVIILFFCLLFYSCTANFSAGSLGGWVTVTFPASEKKLQIAIDSLYRFNPKYDCLGKWKFEAENWRKDYSNLKTLTFCFDSAPEEMYYVTFVEAGTSSNPAYASLAVRGVENGTGRWSRYEDFNHTEQLRIQKRFEEEIISKLEQYTKIKSYQGD